MITLICYVLLLVGAANWLSIGLMQYDFVAGFFGTQSSFLSRMIYIIIGFAAIWMVLMTFKQRGKIKINDNGFNFKRKNTQNDENFNNAKRDNVQAVELDKEIHEANKRERDNPFDKN